MPDIPPPRDATPVDKFGKDHWSALAYVESCCVDGDKGLGHLDPRRMRCNQEVHAALAAPAQPRWDAAYSTRLAGFFDFPERGLPERAIAAGLMLHGHDDWDCLDDLEAAGFVEVVSLANSLVKMTDVGSKAAAALRAHKAKGGQFAGFRMPQPVGAA